MVRDDDNDDSIELQEELFSRTAQTIYLGGTRRISPCWPWILIRVVPKEQQYGNLILPDNDGSASQNKPLAEGIVLSVWKPHWRRIKELNEKKLVWRESDFSLGDRVLFPHHAGLPVNFLDASHYRLVREWTFDVLGGILGKLDYKGDQKMKATLESAFSGLASITLSGK